MKKTLKALVAVRSGSQRVQDKNIRQFANSNLLEIKIKQLLKFIIQSNYRLPTFPCIPNNKIANFFAVTKIQTRSINFNIYSPQDTI
jgi:spore coat polysaccharide biosynthesis protein SpsF (cytidylyltransferase family)